MKVMIKIEKFLCFLLVMFIFISCNSNVVYEESVSVANPTWNSANGVKFEVLIEDTTLDYQTNILIRNSGDYAYQNLWLFVTEIAPDNTCSKDTLQYILADEFGRWLGSGVGSLYTNLCYYKESAHYSQKGKYTYIIEQAMRDEELKGITEVGIQITRKE